MHKHLLLLLSATLLACPPANDDDSSDDDDDATANDDDATGDDDDATGNALRTFMATATGNMGGPTGADAICAADAANPDTSATWKAMLGGLSRVACAQPNCDSGTAGQVDWVFQPNTEYLRPEGGTLFTTNESGVFTAYPLSAGVMNAAANFWTGLDADWTTYTGEHCNDWTTAGVGVDGRVGWTQTLDAAWVQGGRFSCDSSSTLLCVEQ